MIISHKYKFIFIKTCKTASSSVEIALSQFCGSEDIITDSIPEEEEMKRKLGYRCTQNNIIPKSRFSFNDWRRYFYKGKSPCYVVHGSARHIKKYLGKDIWNSYFKFCVERNPWDRMISQYYWKNKSDSRMSMSQFLETEWPLWNQKSGIDLYTIDGKIVVDRICFYENLEEDLEKVRIQCGIPEKLTLPFSKVSTRKDRRHYRNILTNEEAEKIKNLSRREIALFGYQF